MNLTPGKRIILVIFKLDDDILTDGFISFNLARSFKRYQQIAVQQLSNQHLSTGGIEKRETSTVDFPELLLCQPLRKSLFGQSFKKFPSTKHERSP